MSTLLQVLGLIVLVVAIVIAPLVFKLLIVGTMLLVVGSELEKREVANK